MDLRRKNQRVEASGKESKYGAIRSLKGFGDINAAALKVRSARCLMQLAEYVTKSLVINCLRRRQGQLRQMWRLRLEIVACLFVRNSTASNVLASLQLF